MFTQDIVTGLEVAVPCAKFLGPLRGEGGAMLTIGYKGGDAVPVEMLELQRSDQVEREVLREVWGRAV